MAECDILDPSIFMKYLNTYKPAGSTKPVGQQVCCWEQPSQTYNDFVTGVTATYDALCLRDRTFSNYVTQLFNNCLSGGSGGSSCECITAGTADAATSTVKFYNTTGGSFTVLNSALLFNDAFVSGGTLNAETGCVTFTNTSGGTFNVCGFSGFTSYWSGNTDGSISPSGLTTSVGIGTATPDKTFHVKTEDNTVAVFESTDNTCTIKISDATDDAYIVGKNNMLYISDSSGSPSSNAEFAFDYVNGKLGIATTTPNKPLTVVGDISGTTALYLGRSDIFISGETITNGDLSLHGGDDIEIYAGDDIVLNADCRIKFTELNSQSPSLEFELDQTPGVCFIDNGAENTVLAITSADTKLYFADVGGEWISGDTTDLTIASGNDILLQPTSNVGIGTTTPNQKLTVSGVISGTSDVSIGGNFIASGAASNYLQLDNGGATSILLKARGNQISYIGNDSFASNLGIGTTTPNVKLTVRGAISATTDLHVKERTYLGTVDAAGASYTNDEILVRKNDGEVEYLTASQLAQSVVYWSGNSDGSISPSGITTNVGIGTDTPGSLFEVNELIKFNPTYGNSFWGYQSGRYVADNSSTQFNIGVGKWSLGWSNTYGTLDGAMYNVAVGGLSQAYRTTGDYNTSVGQASMQSHTTSSWNTSVGYQAGLGVVAGGEGGNSYNTYIGANSGWYQTGQAGEDTYNTAVGYSSMYTSLAFFSTALGALSQGSGLAPAGCTGCTSVGYKSLYNAGTGGNGAEYNIAIGYQAADNITLGSHNICIGNNADPPSATADYQMNIGGIIHGNDEYSESKIANVGIGYNDPKTVLDVHHSGNDLTSMAVDTGGGEVIYFGLNNEGGETPLSPGKLMFLDNDFYWKYADASAVATGGSQLLALALGTSPSDGLLIRGFFHLNSDEIEGTYDEGIPCYVSETAGATDFTAPTDEGAFVRIIGYAISNTDAEPRLIYFTPDNTWVELR